MIPNNYKIYLILHLKCIIIVKILYLFRLRGSSKSFQWNRISEVHKSIMDIQTIHAKLDSQNGNSREQRSRSLMIIK